MSGMRFPLFRTYFTGCLVAFGLSLFVLSPASAVAQDADIPAPASLGTVTKRLTSRRPATEKSVATSTSTRFTPSGTRIFVPKLVAALSQDAEEKKSLTELFETALKNLDGEQKQGAYDLVPALSLYIQMLQTIHSGKAAPETGAEKMTGQLRAALDSPEIAGLSNSEKQSLYEYWVSMGVLNLMLAQAAEGKSKETLAGLQVAAGGGLKELFGAEPEKIAITAKGLEITGPAVTVAATPPPAAGPRPTYTMPPNSRLEMMGGSTILWRPKYDGYTKNDTEQYYYAIFPTIPAAGKPDREAVFEEVWNDVTKNVKVTWKNRTVIHRFYLPSGAVCYVAMGSERHNETFSGYGSCDGTRMTLCLLDFGNYYVPVAQVYSWGNGYDNLFRLEGAFDAMVATIRLPGATKPLAYATRDQVVGGWTHTDGSYSSTDYVYSSNGAYAGNVTNVSSSRMTMILNADGTARHEFFWYLNGRIQTEVWSGTWTYDKGVITMKNPKTGKSDVWTLMYKGKHPKTNERFLVLHRVYTTERPLSPINAHSTDSQLFTPFKR